MVFAKVDFKGHFKVRHQKNFKKKWGIKGQFHQGMLTTAVFHLFIMEGIIYMLLHMTPKSWPLCSENWAGLSKKNSLLCPHETQYEINSTTGNFVRELKHHLSSVQFSRSVERLLLNDDKFNLGPVMRLDHSELLCNKVLLKYKGDRESFWHRHHKRAERVPPC